MKILQVNKFYYPNRGADKYFLFLEKILRENGHEVRVFSMESAQNLPSKDSIFFSNNINPRAKSIYGKLKVACSIIYNLEAKKKFTALLDDFKPDIIHCHNIYHQLSPSILDAARKKNIPVVMHLHDYKLICPNYKLYSKGKYCKRCLKNNYFQCTKYRCVENSFIKSLLASIEMTVHHKILKIYDKGVNIFITPSVFMRDISVEAGWSPDRFIVLENISPVNKLNQSKIKNYFLYFGALEEEKGIDLAIKAAAETKKNLIIAGEGSYRQELENLANSLQAQISFTGQIQGDELNQLVTESLAIIIPSRWPENMPLAAIEAMSASKTVIASDVGGLSELIKHGENGYLFSVDKLQELKNIMSSLSKNQAELIGKKAGLSRNKKDINWHYQGLIQIYQKVIKEHKLKE